MKKLLALVLTVVMLMSFAACDPSEDLYFREKLEVLLDGYPVELFDEILKDPMKIDDVGDGADSSNQKNKTQNWQAQLDEMYKDVAEPGTVVDVMMGNDLMGLWMQMIINEATFELKELEITEVTSDTNAAYSAVITVTQKGGTTADATISGSVQLSDKGLVNFLQIHSLNEVYTALGIDLQQG